jgi:hypothetical protein
MTEDNNESIVGPIDSDTSIEQLMKAMPPAAWDKLVDTACRVFEQCIAPVTAVTVGCGRLIEAEFERIVDMRKIYAAQTFAKARAKVKKSKRSPKEMPKAPIILKALEESSTQTDETIRELWANLIAQELIEGSVHPEFPIILSRLSAIDAHVLAEIAEKSPKTFNQKEFRIFIDALHKYKIPLLGVTVGGLVGNSKTNFTIEHLSHLNLIEKSGKIWILTITGEEFIKAVSDPTEVP